MISAQITEWRTRNVEKIQLPVFPKSMEELLDIKDASNFCFIQSIDRLINAETLNIHFTAHQFWEQDGPKKMLMKTVEKLSFNPEAYNKTLKIS